MVKLQMLRKAERFVDRTFKDDITLFHCQDNSFLAVKEIEGLQEAGLHFENKGDVPLRET